MPPPIYTVAIDLNDDGNFTGAGEVITSSVLRAHWRLGMAAPHDTYAAPVAAEITLHDPTGVFAPENDAGSLLPGKPLRIQVTHDSVTTTLFTGFVSAVVPAAGDVGGRVATIYAGGADRWLAETPAQMPLLVAARADEAIQRLLDAAVMRRPLLNGVWVLGVADHAELGQKTTLPQPYPSALESGISTFAYLGMSEAAGEQSIAALIAEIVAAERGRFFVDRAGTLVFLNRHHLLLDTVPLATITDSMNALDYTFGADVVNHLRVTVTPRAVGLAGTALWSLENAQRIAPGSERTFTLRYRNAAGNALAAFTVIPPLPDVDFALNTKADGTGADYSGRVRVALEGVGANAALLRIENPHPFALYLLPGAQVRGTPLLGGNPLTVEQRDYASETFYGTQRLVFDLPMIDSAEDAEQIARYELARRAAPRGVVRSVTLGGQAHLGAIIGRSLFDRVRVVESKTGHDAGYFIIAEAHSVDAGGAQHTVTWLLESAAANSFWILGTSLLDSTTSLAY